LFILVNERKSGDMSSIKTVAEEANVSIATVSRVLNHTKYVSPDVEKRVLDAVARLNYHPNAPASNLRRQRTLSIGILVPHLNDFFFSNLIAILEKTLSAQGYSPLFCSTENDEEKEAAAVSNLIRYRVDAVIAVPCVPVRKSAHNLKRLIDQNIPVIVVDRPMPDLPVNEVLSNNEQGGYDGADYLLRLGHRHIGIIDSLLNEAHHSGEPGYERMSGIQRAFSDHNIPFAPDLVFIDNIAYIEVGYQGAMRLLRDAPQVTAIFALTDALAIGVLRAAFELGLNVPRDLSVMGFDNISLASHAIPRLTTLAQPVETIGQTITDLLLRQLQTPDQPLERIVLDTKLVIRESTAPPR
jgi:DNA-binding LacI/PurR family transcriptional regulator